MANVNIKFNGKDYLLSWDDGQEENLKELSEYLSNRFDKLKNELGNMGENKLLLISSIKIIDEYFDLKKKVDNKKREFNNLSNKFKELKSLVINYKEEKDKEINKLKKDLEKFKLLVEENQKQYEEILEKTTNSIENFIETSSKDNSLQ